MGAREQRHANGVSVLLNNCLDDLFNCLMQSGIDHLETSVTQCTRHHLRTAIMAIQTWLSNNYSIGSLH